MKTNTDIRPKANAERRSSRQTSTTSVRFRIFLALALFNLGALAQAQVLTVGPGGTHASLYEAINDADQHTEIRVAEGSYVEPLDAYDASRWFDNNHEHAVAVRKISGGWSAGYTTQRSDPAATRIVGRPHRFNCFDSDMEVSNVTFDGSGSDLPFGVLFSELCNVVLRDAVIENYLDARCVELRNFSTSLVHLHASGDDGFGISLTNVTLRNNKSSSCKWAVALHGPGIGRRISMRGVRLENNVLDTAIPPVFIELNLNSADSLIVEDVVARNNTSELGSQTLFSVKSFNSSSFPGGAASLERLDLQGSGNEARLLSLRAEHRAEMLLGDSLLLGSDDYGVDAFASSGARVRLTNLTVTKNRKGVRLGASGKATAALNNSVVTFNDVDINTIGPTTFLSHNWVDEDPGFVDPDAGDYRLRLDAPAIDSGRRMFRSGLGDLDLDANARIAGWDVDPGAYEAQTGTPPSGPNIAALPSQRPLPQSIATRPTTTRRSATASSTRLIRRRSAASTSPAGRDSSCASSLPSSPSTRRNRPSPAAGGSRRRAETCPSRPRPHSIHLSALSCCRPARAPPR